MKLIFARHQSGPFRLPGHDRLDAGDLAAAKNAEVVDQMDRVGEHEVARHQFRLLVHQHGRLLILLIDDLDEALRRVPLKQLERLPRAGIGPAIERHECATSGAIGGIANAGGIGKIVAGGLFEQHGPGMREAGGARPPPSTAR